MCRYLRVTSMPPGFATYRLLAVLVCLVLSQGQAAARGPSDAPDVVRVVVMDHESLSRIYVTPRGAALRLTANGNEWRVAEGEPLRLEKDGRNVLTFVDGQRIGVPSLSMELAGAGAFDITTDDAGSLRTYSGSFDVAVRPDGAGMTLINQVPLEDYVASVVGSEYGLDDLEGAKAMAVVARTYALHTISQRKPLLDSEQSQVYLGLKRATAAARLAARATAGEVLTWDGTLIDAVYSASNGGRTATNQSLWDTAQLPYLTSREDPFDEDVSPHGSWRFEMEEKRLESTISDIFGTDTQSIRIDQRAPDGRVTRVELKGKEGSRTITGSAFRAALARAFGPMSVKSTYFDLKEKRNRYVITGRGFGHGVGLSQWGAHGMARAGHSYREILAFYYDGTQLARLTPREISSGDTLPALAEAVDLPDAAAGWSSGRKEEATEAGTSKRGRVRSLWRSLTKRGAKERTETPRLGW
ncbi:MAG: SpoIID/LytB domain-containing protein [Rhodothermales bacterium]